MNVLTLSIKQKYFDEILSGTKTKEYREVRPNNFAKYGRIIIPYPGGIEYKSWDDVPDEQWDNEWSMKPVQYDALKLLTGAYKDKRPYIIVEVKSADIYILTDEDGNDILIEDNKGDYYAIQICYYLGEIIETS